MASLESGINNSGLSQYFFSNDNSSSFVLSCNADGCILSAIGMWKDFFNVKYDCLRDRYLNDLWPNSNSKDLLSSLYSQIDDNGMSDLEVSISNGNDEKYYRIIVSRNSSSEGDDDLVVIGIDATQQRIRSECFQTIIDNFPFYFWIKDHNHRILAVNNEYLRSVNALAIDDIAGKTDVDIHKDKYAHSYFLDDQMVVNDGKEIHKEEQYLDVNDKECWLEVWKSPVRIDGSIKGSIGISYDVTERKLAEASVKKSEREFRGLAENNTSFICRFDDQLNVNYMNPVLLNLLDKNLDDVVGSPTPDLSFYSELEKVLEDKENKSIENIEVSLNGNNYFHSVDLIAELDADGEVSSVLVIGRDVTEEIRKKEVLDYYAHHDELTGLPNRRKLSIVLQETVKKSISEDKNFAVLYIDLDGFKPINEAYGRRIGDRVLVLVSQVLESFLTKDDFIAGIGGDEFVILLKSYDDLDHCKSIIENIIKTISTPFEVDIYEIKISVSVGVSLCPEHSAEDEERLLRYANHAMYNAKMAGGSRYYIFDSKVENKEKADGQLTHDLRLAINKRDVKAYFQPIVDIKTGKVVKAEALARWIHPEKGFIPPGDFIPLAEDVGLIHDLGRLVFEQAAIFSKQLNERDDVDRDNPICVTVNMSARQFSLTKTVVELIEFLDRNNIPGSYISIELTESLLIDDNFSVSDQLKLLKDRGVSICLDDFGTGYSALSYLKKYSIDFLKIDRSFIKDVVVDEQDRAIVEAIILMAQRLNIKLIAEGVENEEQYSHLSGVDCDMVQGFLFSPAVPGDRFVEELHKINAN